MAQLLSGQIAFNENLGRDRVPFAGISKEQVEALLDYAGSTELEDQEPEIETVPAPQPTGSPARRIWTPAQGLDPFGLK